MDWACESALRALEALCLGDLDHRSFWDLLKLSETEQLLEDTNFRSWMRQLLVEKKHFATLPLQAEDATRVVELLLQITTLLAQDLAAREEKEKMLRTILDRKGKTELHAMSTFIEYNI